MLIGMIPLKGIAKHEIIPFITDNAGTRVSFWGYVSWFGDHTEWQ